MARVCSVKYPIVLWNTHAHVRDLQKEGMPVDIVAATDGGSVSAGWGVMAMVNRAPHPNAAKLFVNWLASKEGQELWQKVSGWTVTRADVDPSAVPDYHKLKPGINYIYTFDYEFVKAERAKIDEMLRQLIQR